MTYVIKRNKRGFFQVLDGKGRVRCNESSLLLADAHNKEIEAADKRNADAVEEQRKREAAHV